MGESKRRKQLDLNSKQLDPQALKIIEFFGEEWFRSHSHIARLQAYQQVQLLLKTFSADELQEVHAIWEKDSPRRPFFHVLQDYSNSSSYNPPVLIELDASSQISSVL